MFTKTTVSAIQILVYLCKRRNDKPTSPRSIAEKLELSPSYLAKISNQLVKANILRAYRGARGGVILRRPPPDITLLDILEACQGILVGDYCWDTEEIQYVCSFHKAVYEVHKTLLKVLEGWTLEMLAEKACPSPEIAGKYDCRMGLISIIECDD